MLRLPRLAVGTIQENTRSQPICWALMDALCRRGRQLQHFQSRSCFCMHNGALAITGVGSRHLDTWLMDRPTCREIFVHGCNGRDLAVVEGHFGAGDGAAVAGSSLDTLCDWIDLPRLVVLDASKLDDCCWPERPDQVDGLLLDRVASPGDAFRLQTSLESLWDVPVLGALEELPARRAALQRLTGGEVPLDLCHELGDSLSRFAHFEALELLAARRDLRPTPASIFGGHRHIKKGRVTVAVAFDPAFNCYFPDTLDLLEMEGASVVDFSPLRDEALPEADVVYLGCGHPERFAEALSRNHCMLLALRNHVRAGRRVYAEGGGLAYLCQRLEAIDGSMVPMIGALPALARRSVPAAHPKPVEAMLAIDNWLAPAGAPVRGYLNEHWNLEPVGPLVSYLREPGRELDLVGQYQVIGSRLHLNFAAHAQFLKGFLRPRQRSLARSGH